MKRETSETIGTYSPTMEFFGRNKRTGELKEYGEIEIHAKSKRQNTGFYMVWIEQIRPKDTKTKLLLFLIRNMSNKSTILVTNDVLAKKLEVSDKTIRKADGRGRIHKVQIGQNLHQPEFYMERNTKRKRGSRKNISKRKFRKERHLKLCVKHGFYA